MKQKYAIIYPACHGGRFLGELLTLGEDCYSCYVNLIESTTANRLTASVSRYMHSGGWIGNETNFRFKHVSESEKIDLISRHVYSNKLSDNFRIITADAFGNDAGIRWSNASRYKLLVDCYGMTHDEDQHYNILKNSKLPILSIDITEFLNPVFPIAYYKKLCYKLGISPVTGSASILHKLWFEKRVKLCQDCPVISDSLRLSWSVRQQKLFQEKYTLQYNAAVESTARNLKETYHRVSGPDWPAYDTSDNFFDQLPSWIKQECLDFGIDWNNLGTIKVHNYTKLAIKYGYPVDPYYQYTNIIPNLLFIKQHTT
jgi:hypothetical protein